ncbi:hypothetical protein C5O19_05400 [Siphonobacter curvatus]|uniref:Lipoprotein n=2 Tax=Siphonobacter curvatus TaxID=2094562 RepID=A0A2S7IMX2_9BACT|nr:hypothetical protein C5O19_05400 [Siphonobacter curvatus]
MIVSMHKRVYCLLVLVFLIACRDSQKATKLNREKIAILSTSEKTFVPTDQDLLLAERLVKERLEVYNAEMKARNVDFAYTTGDSLQYESDTIQFEHYYRQYTLTVNDEGDKVVAMNCLCMLNPFDKEQDSWRKNKVVVRDGGHCFFQISVNISRGIVYGFMINGLA